jgi:predicted MPP superfamily phosphohydrolase
VLITTPYNGLLTVITITALWTVQRSRRPVACLLAVSAVGVAAGLLAGGLAEDDFGAMRLLAYGLFGFVAVTCAACGVFLRQGHRRAAGIFLAGFVLLECIAIDGFLIEPHWLEVSHVQIVTDKLTEPLKVVLLADLQTDVIGDYERSVIEQIVSEKPDVILFAGDYVQEWNEPRRLKLQLDLRTLLKQAGLAAPLGTYAVRGNVDGGDWQNCFSGTGVTAVSRTRSFTVGELEITCLSVRDSFSTDLSLPASKHFQIVLGHCPNFALGDVPADLLVAGHCHGGQVRLPGIGPLITHSRVPRSWSAGVTNLSGGKKLIVSRGVGMERGFAPPLRFLCRPELVIIELVPTSATKNRGAVYNALPTLAPDLPLVARHATTPQVRP